MGKIDNNLIEPSCLPDCRPSERIESLKGYMLRLAIINGYNCLRFMYKLVGGFKELPGNLQRIDFSLLSVLFDLPQKALKRLAYEKIGRGCMKALGYYLPSNQVLHTRPKMCVACVKMNLTFPAYWDLALFVACPTHKSYLLAECPKCKKTLNWYREMWNKCDCGYDFCDNKAIEAPKAVLDIMNLILCSLKLLDKKLMSNTFPSKLLALPPGDLILALAWIGCWDTGRYLKRIDRTMLLSTLSEKAEIVIAAHRCLINWPQNFIAFLELNRIKIPNIKIKGKLLREFNGLYYTLTVTLGTKAKELFKKAFIEYDTKDRGKYKTPIVNLDNIKDSKLRAAGDKAGLPVMALKKMQNRLGIKLQTIEIPYTTGVIRVDTDSLNDLKERITNRINFKELYSLLGLTYITAVRFRNEGCFSEDTRTIWDGRSDVTYKLDETQKLLAEFNSLAIFIQNVNDKRLTHIYNIFQTYCCHEFTYRELLQFIRNKKIKLYSDSSKGNFENYYIEKEEIIAELLKKLFPEDNDLLSFNAALEKYDLSEYTLRKLLKEKRVESIKIKFGSKYHLLLFEKSLQNYLISVILQLRHNLSFHLSRKEADMAQNWIQFQDGLTMDEFSDSYGTEAQCIAALEKMCWPQGYVCPKCESKSHCIIWHGKIKSFQCNRCHAQMTLTSRTIFNSTKLPLTTWFQAIYFLSQTQNNISTHELTRILGVSYPTALRMKRKIIQVMCEREHMTTLAGPVEIDDA